MKFEPNLKTVLWGGEKIATLKGLSLPPGRTIGESWEVSGLTGRESVVSSGRDAGLTLRQLISRYRGHLVGNRVYRRFGNEFPLIIKFIDARSDLSVQVHPGDNLALERHGCSGKAEMWYIIEADDDAALYAGNCRELSPDEMADCLSRHDIGAELRRHTTAPGDCFFLPAGTLHSIGAGNLLLEVQQASDITYRVWDYDRLDGNGQPRELHTHLAVDAIDYANMTGDRRIDYDRDSATVTLVNSPYFTVGRLMLDSTSPQTVAMPYDAFLVIVNIDGEAVINADNAKPATLHRGETILIPADTRSLTATGRATLITATV